MALQLEIVSEHREIVGDDALREFSDNGGTIGRSLENDWILPDPDRYISARHAVIDCKGGSYYLVDLSTNGVYVNDDKEPIGKGNPRRLYNGDRLRMGDFEITVTIDHGESIEVPLDEEELSIPDNVEHLVPEVSPKTGIQLLDEEAITGDDEFQSALFGDKPADQPAPEPAVADTGISSFELDKPKAVIPDTPKAVPTQRSDGDLLSEFLGGLGIDRTELHPSVDAAQLMRNAGEVMREYVDGMNKLLSSRANLKTAFRLDQTTILPRHNNPLKLSENLNDSIKQLLVGEAGEYLGPRDAVREVSQDLLHHQDAFLDAMTAAFVEFAERFDPDELTAGFDRSIDAKPLLGLLNRLKYWQHYCDIYPVMTEKGGGRFPHMFAEEFVKAYERQIAEAKRTVPAEKPVPVLQPIVENTDFEDDDDDLIPTITEKIPGTAFDNS